MSGWIKITNRVNSYDSTHANGSWSWPDDSCLIIYYCECGYKISGKSALAQHIKEKYRGTRHKVAEIWVYVPSLASNNPQYAIGGTSSPDELKKKPIKKTYTKKYLELETFGLF